MNRRLLSHAVFTFCAPRTLVALLALLLSACTGGAVVFAPTPTPANTAPVEYRHPGGAFTLRVPQAWAVYEQNTTTLASAAFSPPNAREPALTVAVIRLDAPPDSAAFARLLDRYQTQVRRDFARYTEQSREAMADGSWRMTGVRAPAQAAAESSANGSSGLAVNTFVEAHGATLAVTEVLVPGDEAARWAMQAAANSLVVANPSPLQPGDLATLALAHPAPADVLHVSAWTTPDGVFFITGEVANTSAETWTRLPIEAVLQTAEGGSLGGAVDTVMGLGVPPGGFAPFSLRFGGGQPAEAVRYTVTLGSLPVPDAASDEPALVGDEGLDWTQQFAFNEANQLVITGEVANTGDQAVRQLRAVATVFDGAQNVIGAGFADLETAALAPGESAPYLIRLPEIGGEPVNYIVVVQGVGG